MRKSTALDSTTSISIRSTSTGSLLRTSHGLRENILIPRITHWLLSVPSTRTRAFLMQSPKTRCIFFDQFNITAGDLEAYLSEALSRGGDYADLYFEYRINHSIVFEEQIVKSATKGVNLGVGVRVISGEKTGYAYSADLDRENVLKAARTAAFIANSSPQGGKLGVPSPIDLQNNLYAIPLQPADLEIERKILLLREADETARSCDSRIKQVQASY